MAEEQPGAWFGFGFCGFGQALGSGRGRRRQVHSPEPLGAGVDIGRVSASWSYTALVTRGGHVQLSGSASGAAGGCRDAWASEGLLVVLRAGPGPGSRALLQAWAPGSALHGEPLWAQDVVSEAEGEDGADCGPAGRCPCARASHHVSARSAGLGRCGRTLELGLSTLPAGGAVFSWGGQVGVPGERHLSVTRSEPEPPADHGLPCSDMDSWATGPWRQKTGDIYVWGWNESGQLALPTRSLAEDRRTATGEGLKEDGAEVRSAAEGEEGAPAPFIAIQPFPALLDLPRGADAVQASCGSRHTAVVTRTGELYTWGWGKYGQLGHKDAASLDRPWRVEYFVDKQLQVKAVTCGPWNTYVFAVEKGKH
uniref:RCC1 domain containing 1 n=1 Tax=Microcebus murinus TaxID=30608 RepID=A0A8C5UW28_MICMU